MVTDRDSIFEGEDPVQIAARWLAEAEGPEPNDPNAAALATVDADGLPNVRIVLVKEIETDGFVFFTNYNSAKGRELDAASKAALVLHWKSLRRQIRVRGSVERVSPDQSDRYYNSRGLESRIGAWASQQSQKLESKEVLRAVVDQYAGSLGENPARPEHWGGYRIRPLEIEFWADGAHRLHDRFCWCRSAPDSDWEVNRLFP